MGPRASKLSEHAYERFDVLTAVKTRGLLGCDIVGRIPTSP